MKYVYLAMNWILGLLFLTMGLVSMVESPLAGLSLVLLSFLLLPPVRKFFYSKVNIQIPIRVKAVSIFALIAAYAVFLSQSENNKAQEVAAQEAEAKEKTEKTARLEQENIAYFTANKEKIVLTANSALATKEYQSVISQTSKYLMSGDEELKNINSIAKIEIEKIRAREKQIEEQFSAWDGSHRNLERVIKKAMNDPDSYEHDETKYWDRGDHLIVETTYRGKNAFGGVVKNYVKAKISLDGQVLQILDQT